LSDSFTPGLRRATILVVDDEALVRLMVADELRDRDYQVVEAASGEEAIGLLRAGVEVNLVFTDVRMPGSIDGLALARLVDSEFPELKVIIASGYVCSLPAGVAKGFFSKPYDLSAVARKIETVLKAPSRADNGEKSVDALAADSFGLAAERRFHPRDQTVGGK
jgi:DNA-binding NtrC family response regulator